MEAHAVISSTILKTPEDDQCWLKHVVCITGHVEETLTFKTFKVLKRKLHVRWLTGINKEAISFMFT
jgi:hypothetical protein